MSDVKILELNTKPPVSVYNHHAFGTGIITTAPWGMNWIYNNYIMLGFYPDEGALTFDFYMDYIYCQPVFNREFLSNSIVKYNTIVIPMHGLRRFFQETTTGIG